MSNQFADVDGGLPEKFSFVFTNSASDREATNLICGNLNKCSFVTAEHGFGLEVIKVGEVIVVRLVKKDSKVDIRRVASSLEQFISKEREKKEAAQTEERIIRIARNSVMNMITDKFDELSNKLLAASPQVRPTSTPARERPRPPFVQPEPEERLPFKRYPSSPIPMPPPPRKIVKREIHYDQEPDMDEFFDQRNMELLKRSPDFIDKLYERMIEEDKTVKEPLLRAAGSEEIVKKELQEFVDSFQKSLRSVHQSKSIKTPTQINIAEWFNKNWDTFLPTPTEEELKENMENMKNNFQLDNTIGTLRFYRFRRKGPLVFTDVVLVIVNHKVIDIWCNTSDKPKLTGVYHYLKTNSPWIANRKFVTDVPVPDEFSDIFLYSDRQEVFKEDDKVITWLEANFQALKLTYSLANKNFLIMVAIYMFCLDYYMSSNNNYA